MEAHILGSLVPSIEHLILIGDPLQLRPTLNNYCEPILNDSGIRGTNCLSYSFVGGKYKRADLQIWYVANGAAFYLWASYVSHWRSTPNEARDIELNQVRDILLSPPSYCLFTIITETLFIQDLKITNSLRSTQTFEGSNGMCSSCLIIIVKMKVVMTRPANSTCMRCVVMTFHKSVLINRNRSQWFET